MEMAVVLTFREMTVRTKFTNVRITWIERCEIWSEKIEFVVWSQNCKIGCGT